MLLPETFGCREWQKAAAAHRPHVWEGLYLGNTVPAASASRSRPPWGTGQKQRQQQARPDAIVLGVISAVEVAAEHSPRVSNEHPMFLCGDHKS
jgi:hypothetical protein